MYTAPNQKVVTIRKTACDKSNVYATINVESARKASKNLTDNARLLWMYFAMNADGYTLALSNVAVAEQWNMERKRYFKAVNELTEKGYLVHTGGKNYDFIECPDASIAPSEDNEKSQNGTFKSPEMGYSKVPKQDIQKSQNGTFKSTKTGLLNVPKWDKKYYKDTTIDTINNSTEDREPANSEPHKSKVNVSQYEYDDDYGFGESVPSKRDESDTMKRSPEYWDAYRKWQKSFNMPTETQVIRVAV